MEEEKRPERVTESHVGQGTDLAERMEAQVSFQV